MPHTLRTTYSWPTSKKDKQTGRRSNVQAAAGVYSLSRALSLVYSCRPVEAFNFTVSMHEVPRTPRWRRAPHTQCTVAVLRILNGARLSMSNWLQPCSPCLPLVPYRFNIPSLKTHTQMHTTSCIANASLMKKQAYKLVGNLCCDLTTSICSTALLHHGQTCSSFEADQPLLNPTEHVELSSPQGPSITFHLACRFESCRFKCSCCTAVQPCMHQDNTGCICKTTEGGR